MPASEATNAASAHSRIRWRGIQSPVCRLAKTLPMLAPLRSLPKASFGPACLTDGIPPLPVRPQVFHAGDGAADIAADLVRGTPHHGAREGVGARAASG